MKLNDWMGGSHGFEPGDKVRITDSDETRGAGLSGRNATIQKIDRFNFAHLFTEGHQRVVAVPVNCIEFR